MFSSFWGLLRGVVSGFVVRLPVLSTGKERPAGVMPTMGRIVSP